MEYWHKFKYSKKIYKYISKILKSRKCDLNDRINIRPRKVQERRLIKTNSVCDEIIFSSICFDIIISNLYYLVFLIFSVFFAIQPGF
jgi:hypothetical protein